MRSRLHFAKQSSTRAGLLSAAVAVAGVVAVVGLGLGAAPLAVAGLAAAAGASVALGAYLIVSERRRHEVAEEELTAQATFLESLVESIGAIASTLDERQILEQTRRESERLFEARARLLGPDRLSGSEPQTSGRANSRPGSVVVPLHVRGKEIAALLLERERPFERWDIVRATVLADFAARATENASLLAEAQVREAERARLSDQLITAEQDERRRLALFLHDGPVQNLAGIALMLDAALHSIGTERLEEAAQVMGNALERHRDTIRSLRDLSFNLEPVVLRDQGFGPAIRELADQIELSNDVQLELDVGPAEALAEKAQVVLYQIIREALHQALRRGPPKRISIRIEEGEDGTLETVIADDGAGERRRSSFDAIAERARTLNGQMRVGPGIDGGTAVQIVLPSYTARR